MKIRERLIKWLGGTSTKTLVEPAPSTKTPVEHVHSNINFTPIKSVVVIDHPADEAEAQHRVAQLLGDFLYDNFLIFFDTIPVDDGNTKVEGLIYIGKKEDN